MKLAHPYVRTQILKLLKDFNSGDWRREAQEKCQDFLQDWDLAASLAGQQLQMAAFGPNVSIPQIYWLSDYLIEQIMIHESPPSIGGYFWDEEELAPILRLAAAFDKVARLRDWEMRSNSCCEWCSSNWKDINNLAAESERLMLHFDQLHEHPA